MNSIRRQIKSMLTVEAKPNGFRAVFNVSRDLTIFPDHFSYAQILPGICMIQAVLLSCAMSQGLEDMQLITLKNAKMLQPVLPGDRVQIDGDTTAGPDGQTIIKARITSDEKRRAEFSLIARAHSPQEVASA